MVPFLMFALVTTNAAVADAAETSIATRAAMIADFMVFAPFSRSAEVRMKPHPPRTTNCRGLWSHGAHTLLM